MVSLHRTLCACLARPSRCCGSSGFQREKRQDEVAAVDIPVRGWGREQGASREVVLGLGPSPWYITTIIRAALLLSLCSYAADQVDVVELATLLQRVATPAPGQSFDVGHPTLLSMLHQQQSAQNDGPGGDAASGDDCVSPAEPRPRSTWSSSSGSSSGCGGSGQELDILLISPDRLRTALRNSLAVVAAYAPEEALVSSWQPQQQQQQEQPLQQHQRIASADSSSSSRSSTGSAWWEAALPLGWPPAPAPPRRRVLVGFARAVGDGSLIATVHDVAVAPELQGRGLGAQLLERLTSQLYQIGIVDVGLLAPAGAATAFFQACNFGDDPEESVTMALSPAAMAAYLVPGRLGIGGSNGAHTDRRQASGSRERRAGGGCSRSSNTSASSRRGTQDFCRDG